MQFMVFLRKKEGERERERERERENELRRLFAGYRSQDHKRLNVQVAWLS